MKVCQRRRGLNRGFTFIEILIALAIFVIGAVILLNSLGIGIFSISALERRSQAYYLANHRLERIYARHYPNIVSEPRAPVVDWPPVPAGQNPIFELETQVTELEANLLKEVTAIVYYRTKGREISVKLVTLIANRG